MMIEPIIEKTAKFNSKLEVRMEALRISISKLCYPSTVDVRTINEILEEAKLISDFLLGENSTLPENPLVEAEKFAFGANYYQNECIYDTCHKCSKPKTNETITVDPHIIFDSDK